ncbi:MAG TPA: ATP-dependent Clp protease adapter ClpS [Gammaproteobacteria bacterium]|nr:ATP-dependent Clp protease adapter ClpS [Gammaproteobacteria bacterium]
MTDEDHKSGDGLALQEAKPVLKRPGMYRVLLINDDYTPMDFVIMLLQSVFRKDHDAATQIMLHVHTKGFGVCGVFTREIAETKVRQVMDLSQQGQHPLQCEMEPDNLDE